MLGDALAILGGCGFDTTFFFVEAALFELATNFWGQILGFVDGAAVVVAEAAGGLGSGDGCERDFVSARVDESIGRGQWWLVSFVLRCFVVFEATEGIAKSALDNVLSVAS